LKSIRSFMHGTGVDRFSRAWVSVQSATNEFCITLFSLSRYESLDERSNER